MVLPVFTVSTSHLANLKSLISKHVQKNNVCSFSKNLKNNLIKLLCN